ncbi:MAG TPA: Gfo/Idh/MocA family oxidoreductase [Candidatus Binataceae bacterium]|nr:Gfo/Idh/MocA family oxidoreductase [Candidatus Binataceae bacterium]
MMLRGAISGFGEVAAQAHLAGWRTRPEVNLVAIHDPLSERRHHAMRLIPNIRVYDDLELMLDGERLDFVDVASPPAYHAATALTALAAGAHVLVEKPLCLAAGEFESLRAAAASRGRVLMCVHNWKYAATYRLAHDLIRDGRLGEIRYVALDRLRTAPAGIGLGASGRWRLGAASGGGILVDHGWHVFYLMRWLMGGLDPTAVAAFASVTQSAPVQQESPVERKSLVEDVADLRVIFPADRIASAHLSWRSPVRRTRAMLYGSEAALEIDGDRVILTARSGKSEDLSTTSEADDSYHSAWFAAMAADFERAVLEGVESPTAAENLAEARAALALTLGAQESSRYGGGQVKLA